MEGAGSSASTARSGEHCGNACLADLVQRCSGHALHGAAADVGFEPEQSCRFLFQMVRVSSQAQSFLFLFTSMCRVIS